MEENFDEIMETQHKMHVEMMDRMLESAIKFGKYNQRIHQLNRKIQLAESTEEAFEYTKLKNMYYVMRSNYQESVEELKKYFINQI